MPNLATGPRLNPNLNGTHTPPPLSRNVAFGVALIQQEGGQL